VEQPYRPGFLERILHLVPGIGPDVKAIMVKDIRSFWRDTTQWGQTIVLFGLLGVYIINLRHFSRQLNNAFWISLVSHLNLLACSLNLATLTTRFVFPQFSQEGKRVWIIGMAPLGLAKVMRAKFWLSSFVSWGVTCVLMFVSCRMLKMPWQLTLHYMAAVSVMAATLSAIAIGLGTLYPNLKEDHPGKIVSGFGGTFCLVLSFLYIVGAIAIMATGAYWGRWRPRFYETQWLSWIGFVLWSTALGWFPYRLGFRKLSKWEI
jgi:ABC-2 type transport system permease protein